MVLALCCLYYIYSFGGDAEGYPHPELEWHEFVAAVQRENEKIPKVWDPRSQRDEHWVRTSKLGSAYSVSKCIIS